MDCQRYEHALEDDDDDVSWTYENGQDLLRFLFMDDTCRREASIPMTAVSSELSTRLPTPASDVIASASHPTTGGVDSFAAGVLTQLGIPAHMANHNDHGLHVVYEKYKAYLEACHEYERKVADWSWTGGKLTGVDLIQLLISKLFWHSHYKPLFCKVPNHMDMMKWLEG